MKTYQIFFPLFFMCLCISPKLDAQECHGYFPFKPGTEIEMTYYDKKGKVTSINQVNIEDIEEYDGQTQALVNSRVLDKKGNESYKADFEVRCTDEGYQVDITNMINPMLLQSANGMEMKIEGDALIYPNDLAEGKVLEDAFSEIKVYSNDIKLLTMNFDISNRKVEKAETITTAAGSYECYLLSYDFNTKMAFAKRKYHVKQWIADGVGVVREEMYGKKNKLESSAELTKFKPGS